MDVKCERCSTEYEFDDALVSGRGTTVKCTNCGHKFKIRRHDGDFSEDFWNVTTGDGRTLVFTSLRELQRAIQTHLVERTDRLSRGGLPPKPIGQIPELVSFFDVRDARKSQPPEKRATQDGPPPAHRSSRPPPPPGALGPSLAPPRARQPTRPEFPAPPAPFEANPSKTTLIGTGSPLPEQAPTFVPTVTPSPRGAAVASGGPPPVPSRGPPAASTMPPPTERDPDPESIRDGYEAEEDAAYEAALDAHVFAQTAILGSESSALDAREAREAIVAPPAVHAPVAVRETSPRPPAPAAVDLAPLIDDEVGSPPPPNRESTRLPTRSPSAETPRVSQPPPLPARARTFSVPPPAPVVDVSSPLPHAPVRSLLAEMDEPDGRHSASADSLAPPRRRSVGAFIVAAVVALGALTVGAVWAQKHYGITIGGARQAPSSPLDPKVTSLLDAGEKALADGNVERAKESFDKASVLAERDPRLLVDVARLAAARADVAWLKTRLLPADASDEHRMTRESLTELALAAKKASDDAAAVAPDEPASLRAKIDALRIAGERDAARALVGKIGPSATSPESAYVLAALDVAEVEPLWSTVVERLRSASGAETGPGRARALLVYALARSGDVAAARAELDRLSAMSRAHPLLALLRAYTERAKPAPRPSASVAVGAVPSSVAPIVSAPFGGAPSPGDKLGDKSHGGGAPLSGDPRELVRQGDKARGKGDLDRARTLYSAALEKNPNDSEALTGIAAIAHARRDLDGARASFKRVLAINPNYMPALVGLADVEWESGDHASALKIYKDIVDRYPAGTYPARVRERAESGGGG